MGRPDSTGRSEGLPGPGLGATRGLNWTGCSGARPTFGVLPDDCGERQYLSQNAILRAEMRSGYGSLKRLRTYVGPASGDANVSVVSITSRG